MKRSGMLRILAAAGVLAMVCCAPVYAEDVSGTDPNEYLSNDGLGADGLEPGEDGYDWSDHPENWEDARGDEGYDWSDHPENWEDARGDEGYDWSDHPENWEDARGEEWEDDDNSNVMTGENPMGSEEGILNICVLANGAEFSGLQNIQTINFDDGSYFYEDLTEDGMTRIVNQSFVWMQWADEDIEAYINRIISEVGGSDVREIAVAEDEMLTEKFTYPAYRVQWIYGGSEDTRQCTAVMTNNDEFTFLYYFDCPIDAFEEMAETYEEILQGLEFL